MTRAVQTIHPSDDLAGAIARMTGYGLSGLPVVDEGGRLVGVLTEGDLLRRVETGTETQRPKWVEFLRGPGRAADDYVSTHARRVEDLMTRDVITVAEDTPLEEVVTLMQQKHIKRLPVMRGERLIGIVSRADVVRQLGRALRQRDAASVSDSEIRDQLLASLQGQLWYDPRMVAIGVEDGVVTLEGAVSDDRARNALIVAARNVAGVKDVIDRLALVELTTGAVIEPFN
jgi:CBS domain-containing protein